jgi:hypothetical protein
MDEARDSRHDDEHDDGQRIDPKSPVDGQLARGHPIGDLDDLGMIAAAEAHHEKGDPGQERAKPERNRGDEFRVARADLTAEQPGDQKTEQRKEDD